MRFLSILLRIISYIICIFGGILMFSVGASIGAGGNINFSNVFLALVILTIGFILLAIAKKMYRK